MLFVDPGKREAGIGKDTADQGGLSHAWPQQVCTVYHNAAAVAGADAVSAMSSSFSSSNEEL